MARFIYGMSQSLDGYVDGVSEKLQDMPPPGPALHQFFNDHVRGLAGALYGRKVYELMRYWDEDQDDWGEVERDFAAAWRPVPKWVVSRTLKSVGPNATLVGPDLEGFARKLRHEVDGDVDVAGPTLAGSLTALGLVDEYQLIYRPYVLGAGVPFFTGPRPPLRIVSTDRVGEDAVRVVCVPA